MRELAVAEVETSRLSKLEEGEWRGELGLYIDEREQATAQVREID